MKSLIHPTANEFNFDRWAIAGPIDKSFKALRLQDKNLRLVTRKDWKYPSVAGDAKRCELLWLLVYSLRIKTISWLLNRNQNCVMFKIGLTVFVNRVIE